MVWAFKKRQSKLVVNRSCFFFRRPQASTNKAAFPKPASLEQRSEEIMGGLCKPSLFFPLVEGFVRLSTDLGARSSGRQAFTGR